MNCHLTGKIKLVIFFACLVVFLAGFKPALAETEKDINATIKLSICGNAIAEYPEDCDGVDLDQKNCHGLGFASGDLDCDLSCEYDTSRCTGVAETPTPTPAPTAAPTTAPTPTATAQSSSSTTSSSSQSVTAAVARVVEEIVKKIDAKFQEIQKNFDFDGSGKIEVYEVYDTVKTWVEDWQANLRIQIAYAKGEITGEELVKPEKCDINQDGVCDAVDLSVLFFYVDR